MSELEFKELNLSEELLKAVSSMGFKKTTPIQSKAIPEIISIVTFSTHNIPSGPK